MNKFKKLTRDQRKWRTAIIMLLPALVFLALLIAYPLGKVIHDAFYHVHLINKSMTGFAGMANFQKVLADEHFGQAVKNTAYWTIFSVLGEYLVGMVTAVLLNQKFKGRGFARAISLVPWAVSGVLVTMLWTLMYDQSSGLINDMLMKSGIISKKVAWLADSRTFFPAVNIAELWRGVPFFAINILAALQSIPADVYESSAIDGCGPVKNFFYITLPYLKESIIFATLLRGIWEFNSIDMIFTMTNGGPMDKTTTLPIYMMKTAIIKGNYGYGSTIGVIAFLILLVFAVFYIKVSGFGGEENE